ncbi:hypothetical protein BDQ12DRAFT_674572 [Crucibulum laeve]|uniref:WKF domain-containing protein n=1 Tax=Crucibulum laeve TaxID=68775 RepID=A0A5C3MCY2_9AGAR|nr:hypothetical protein BDQ12DRAFT_674572 [Crucibulum laeve]
MEPTSVGTDKKLSKKERKKAKKQETVEMEVDEVETGKSAVVETEKKISKSEKKAKEQVPEQVKELKVSAEEPKEGGEERRKKRKKGTVAAEPEEETVKEDGPPKKKRKNKTGLADPDDDKTLTNQARKALLYAFEQFRRPDKWKFQKARQNWLVRNIWSAEAIPEAYEPLLIKYLSETKGGVRENLIKSCRTILEPQPATQEPVPAPKQVDPPKEGAKPATGGALVMPVVEKAPDPIKQARAKLILQALESFVDPET